MTGKNIYFKDTSNCPPTLPQIHLEYITHVFQSKGPDDSSVNIYKVFIDICLSLEALQSLELGWCTDKELNFHCMFIDIPQTSSERLQSSET